MIFFQLFYTFFLIGMFTVGGGMAMISLIQHQVVVQHQWISMNGFTDIIAISQMSPGPIGVNSATYIGYSVIHNLGYAKPLCILGSFTATFAVVLPSFLIVLWIAILFTKFKKNIWFKSILSGLRPAVIGLIGAAAVILMNPENFIEWKSWVLFGLAFISAKWIKANPILIIILGGIAGILIYS
ncbi:MAG: chromate transporter [Bacteroidales bacterium]